MKITNRDNGVAKLLFVKQERNVSRGMARFLHLPGNIEYDTVKSTELGEASLPSHFTWGLCYR